MNLPQFAAELEKLTTTQQLEKALRAYLQTYGFRYYAVTYYSHHIKTGRKLIYDHVSQPLRAWHLHYLEQGYADADRTLEEAYTWTLPLYWDVQQQLQQAKNKREQRIRRESIEFGIDKGLSIPVHGPQRDFISLTLHQCRNETCLQNYESLQYEWLSAAQIFYHYLRKILRHVPVVSHQLTRREKECLLLTAKSWRVEQIAKELNISVRTVNFHLQNANKKMGVNNKYQAVRQYMENNE